MALERLAVMLGLIYTQKCGKSFISLGNFDSWAERHASFFHSVGETEDDKKKRISFLLTLNVGTSTTHHRPY